ncbi:unnamed protein product, partial [marine sediment metagenome]
ELIDVIEQSQKEMPGKIDSFPIPKKNKFTRYRSI